MAPNMMESAETGRHILCPGRTAKRLAGAGLVDFPDPGGDPTVVGPDVVAPPGDALEPVEEPGGLDPLEPYLRPHSLHFAPLYADRTLLQPRPDDLAHQDLPLPLGGPVPSLSDHRSPFLVPPLSLRPAPAQNCRIKHSTFIELLRDHFAGTFSLVEPLPALFSAIAHEQRVTNGHHEKREEGRGYEAAYHGDGQTAGDEGAPAASDAEGQRREGEDRRESGHQDGPKTRPSGLHDRLVERRVPVAGVLDKVHEQDGVRDDDPDQEQHPEQRRDAQGRVRQQQRPEGTDRGERDGEQYDQGYNQRPEENDQDEVDEPERHGNREYEVPEALLDVLRLAPDLGRNTLRQVQLL